MKEILNSVHFQKDDDVSTELTATSVLKQYLTTEEIAVIPLGMQA